MPVLLGVLDEVAPGADLRDLIHELGDEREEKVLVTEEVLPTGRGFGLMFTSLD